MKDEALKLADELQKHFNCYNEYSDMIRRLVEELDKQKETIRKLNKTLGFINSGYEVINLEPQTKPLSDEEIWELHQEHIDEIPCGHSMKTIGFVEFARAIEERHGIK